MQKKVLVADDDYAIVDALQFMLEEAGYEVITADDANDIPELLKQKPDLLLLDIWMSGANGGDVCRNIKGDDQTKHVPVIMVSANKDTSKIAQECGANDYISKPFEMDELLKKVATHIQ